MPRGHKQPQSVQHCPAYGWANLDSCGIHACVLNNACFPRFNEPGHSSIKTKSVLSSVNCLAQLSTDWATPVTNGIGALVAGARITASENFNFAKRTQYESARISSPRMKMRLPGQRKHEPVYFLLRMGWRVFARPAAFRSRSTWKAGGLALRLRPPTGPLLAKET